MKLGYDKAFLGHERPQRTPATIYLKGEMMMMAMMAGMAGMATDSFPALAVSQPLHV